MKVFGYYLATLILFIITFISRLLSRKNRARFGIFLGVLLRLASKKREKITLKNLKIAFPDKDEAWLKSICRKSYHNLGITLAELTCLTKYNKQNINEIYEIENPELFHELKNKNRGVIFLSAHYANWEVLAYGGGLVLDTSLLIIVKPQSNFVSDRVLNSIRIYKGNRVVSMYSAAREIIKEVSNGGVLALLADQSATPDKDVYVDFFGLKTVFYKSPAELALRFNVPVIVPVIKRDNDFKYKVVLDLLDVSDLKYNKEGIIEFTQRYANYLEKIIRENPELWAWQHKKWKHTFDY